MSGAQWSLVLTMDRSPARSTISVVPPSSRVISASR